MTSYTYKQIVSKARECKKNVESKYELGMTIKWSYYFAMAIQSPNKPVSKITIADAPKPNGTYISRTVSKTDYLALAKKLSSFIKKEKRMPNYLRYGDYKILGKVYTYALARILVFYVDNGRFPSTVNINSKSFTKPVETSNKVYKYFVKVFGAVSSIDEALTKVKDKGYSYYYDDKYSNTESIDRIKKGLGVNCTDSCHVFYNIVLGLIDLGKYKKVECIHVQCSSGGHVKLRITLNDDTKIIRDPACVLSNNGKAVTCVWCTNTPKAVNPKWFMDNLNR